LNAGIELIAAFGRLGAEPLALVYPIEIKVLNLPPLFTAQARARIWKDGRQVARLFDL